MPTIGSDRPYAVEGLRQFRSTNRYRGKYNPLVRVTLVISGLLAVSLSRNPIQFAYVAVVFLLLNQVLGSHLRPVGRSVWIMLPWTLAFFAVHLGFYILFEHQPEPSEIILRESIVLLRFIGLAGVMGALREGINAQSLVDSAKTLMDRLKIRSRRGEDFLQTLRLILVFIPQVAREYQILERFNLALGFKPPIRLREKVSFYGGNLLPVLAHSLARAQQLGEVMSVRGYGQVIPRGQLTPLPFRFRDGAAAATIAVLLGSSRWVF